MSRIFIVPDVHERLDRLEASLKLVDDNIDGLVFLGDWFDTFKAHDDERCREVCRFINNNIDGVLTTDPPKPADFLLGNHDCHYFFNHHAFLCSGYHPRKKEIITGYIAPETIRKFKLFVRHGNYLISHAGFNTITMQFAEDNFARQAIDEALQGKFDPVWGAGKARGGNQMFGGPTWLDWHYEFEPVQGAPQIVGHTNDTEVRTKWAGQEVSYCIDTASRHVAILDTETNEVEILDVPS